MPRKTFPLLGNSFFIQRQGKWWDKARERVMEAFWDKKNLHTVLGVWIPMETYLNIILWQVNVLLNIDHPIQSKIGSILLWGLSSKFYFVNILWSKKNFRMKFPQN